MSAQRTLSGKPIFLLLLFDAQIYLYLNIDSGDSGEFATPHVVLSESRRLPESLIFDSESGRLPIVLSEPSQKLFFVVAI
jgi:hypothetical protein